MGIGKDGNGNGMGFGGTISGAAYGGKLPDREGEVRSVEIGVLYPMVFWYYFGGILVIFWW